MERFSKTLSSIDVFYHLAFAICAPQTTFKANRKVNEELKRLKFHSEDIPRELLEVTLKPVRFYRTKAENLLLMKEDFPQIASVLRGYSRDFWSARLWLVRNVRGLGMKAASHFLRNLGSTELAIIDTHILKYLGVESAPTSELEYARIEMLFRDRAEELGKTPAALDAEVWAEYSGTRFEDFDR